MRKDANLRYRDQSDNVNDYLAIDGWILLNTGTRTAEGDSVACTWCDFVLRCIGNGAPQFPLQRNGPALVARRSTRWFDPPGGHGPYTDSLTSIRIIRMQ